MGCCEGTTASKLLVLDHSFTQITGESFGFPSWQQTRKQHAAQHTALQPHKRHIHGG